MLERVNNIPIFNFYNIPDSKHSERAILHSKSKMDSIGTNCGTANGFLHIAPGNQSMVY